MSTNSAMLPESCAMLPVEIRSLICIFSHDLHICYALDDIYAAKMILINHNKQLHSHFIMLHDDQERELKIFDRLEWEVYIRHVYSKIDIVSALGQIDVLQWLSRYDILDKYNHHYHSINLAFIQNHIPVLQFWYDHEGGKYFKFYLASYLLDWGKLNNTKAYQWYILLA